MRPPSRRSAGLLVLLFCLAPPAMANEDQGPFESFRRAATLGLESLLIEVFAVDSVLARIDSLPEGEALRLDLNRDGAIDGLAWREGSIRVAAIDEDGDLNPEDRRPDRDSDCYVADIDADGAPDRAVDFIDLDGDGDPDRQDLYEISRGALGVPGLGVTIVLDLDDDDRLFQTTEYGYHANRDQWGSDFDGDVCFLAARRDEETGLWTSVYENPFCFYDNDGDGWSDEALRLEGEDLRLNSLRWSFDVDGDASGRNDRDYDFSLTATGPVTAPPSFADTLWLRDGRSVRYVSWKRARDLARWALWRSVLLVWDEDDHNTAPFSAEPDRERWEGVVAEGYRGFPPIGGPACGQINKRYELDRDGSGRLALYWSDVDERIHLLGAEIGTFQIVLPGDRAPRPQIQMKDTNANGFFDTWTWAAGSGADRERTVTFADEAVRLLPVEADSLRRFWRKALPAARNRARWDLDQLDRSRPQPSAGREPGPVRRWWEEARTRNEPLAVRAERSLEAERLLRDLVLWEIGGGFLARDPQKAAPAVRLRIETPVEPGCPLLVPTARLPESAGSEIPPLPIVELVFRGGRIAGQAEDLDGDGSIDLYYFPPVPVEEPLRDAALEIQPASPLRKPELVRVDPWFGSGIAIESMEIAYRAYDGLLDLFVKNRPRLILRGDLGDYHRPQGWGTDPLVVGGGPGIGGLYLRSAGEWVSLFGADRLRSQRVVAPGPLRAILEITVEAAGTEAVRTFTLAAGGTVLVEQLTVVGEGKVTLAAALPHLGASGELPGIPGIWSYGASVPGTGPIGLAGAILSEIPSDLVTLGKDPAIRFEATPGETILLAWVAGGTPYGDSTAVIWVEKADELLRERLRPTHSCP